MQLTIEDLKKAFAGVPALADVALDVAPGRIVALIGPNGAGKTTLLRCLAGIYVPDGGTIAFDDVVFERHRLDQRRRLAFLPDTPVVWPGKSVIQHVGVVMRLYGVATDGAEGRVLDLLRDFDLLPLAEARLSDLSRGQLYKAALVGFLAVDPELWLLDEPFSSGMDPHGLTALRRHLSTAAGRGRTVLYTTQLLEIAERFGDDVCVLQRGRVRAYGPKEELSAAAGGALEEILRRLREVPA